MAAAAAQVAEEEASAAAQTAAAQAAVAAAENTQLRAQVQQLRTQLHHEKGISQGLLDACQQPEVAAAANTAANTEAEVPEWAGKCAQLGVKVQMVSKQHDDSNTVYSHTDSRITEFGYHDVGVRRAGMYIGDNRRNWHLPGKASRYSSTDPRVKCVFGSCRWSTSWHRCQKEQANGA